MERKPPGPVRVLLARSLVVLTVCFRRPLDRFSKIATGSQVVAIRALRFSDPEAES